MYTERNSENLLEIENDYVRADWKKRLLNYAIDWLFFLFIFFGIIILLTAISPLADEFVESRFLGITTAFTYAIYMSLIETMSKGKSIGKLITRTRAIKLDGEKIKTTTAFARGFIRIVPFCAFSALGNRCNPWQDRWTNTIVIDEKNSEVITK